MNNIAVLRLFNKAMVFLSEITSVFNRVDQSMGKLYSNWIEIDWYLGIINRNNTSLYLPSSAEILSVTLSKTFREIRDYNGTFC